MSFLFPALGWIYQSLVPFTILLGILVFVHELGHFLVARFCGVRVEVFSLGFGKKILSYKRGDTTYCLSLIPLGGYVKMFGEQGGDVVPVDQQSVSFTHKNVWQRIAIVLAGPLMNLFFAVLVFGFIAYRGEETRSARLADIKPGSVAELAGIKSHDLVVSVNDKKVRNYEEFQNLLNEFQNQDIKLNLIDVSGATKDVSVKVSSEKNPNPFSAQAAVGTIEGVMPYSKGTLIAVQPDSVAAKIGFKTGDEITLINDQKAMGWNSLNKIFDASVNSVTVDREVDGKKSQAVVDVKNLDRSQFTTFESIGIENPELYLQEIVADSPAALAGVEKFDKIVSINNISMSSWDQVLQTIKSYDGKDALEIKLLREGTEVIKKVTPKVTSQMTMQGKEDRRYTIGIVPMVNIATPEMVIVSDDHIFAAIGKGWDRSWDISAMTVMSFVRLFQGEVSHKNIGGLISIGKAAKDSFELGLQTFLQTMGILSISLFILNLLPVPVLDGGHLVFYMVEIVKGSPLSLRKMEIAHQIGFALLMGLMVLALFNDVTRFLF